MSSKGSKGCTFWTKARLLCGSNLTDNSFTYKSRLLSSLCCRCRCSSFLRSQVRLDLAVVRNGKGKQKQMTLWHVRLKLPFHVTTCSEFPFKRLFRGTSEEPKELPRRELYGYGISLMLATCTRFRSRESSGTTSGTRILKRCRNMQSSGDQGTMTTSAFLNEVAQKLG